MENKEYIIWFRSGAWQKVVCKDMKIVTNVRGNEIDSIDFEQCEGGTEPLFLNKNEVVGIFPSAKKNKDVKQEPEKELTIEELEAELERYKHIGI